jgi:hypothetical protein
MADIEDIANRIAGIILSPETVVGLVHGAASVPLDLGYMAYGIFDTDSRFQRQTEQIRMSEAIKNDLLNYEHITNAVELIFEAFNKYLSESQQDKIYRGVISSIVGRLTTNMLATKIATSVIERVSFISSTKGGLFSLIFLIDGMMQRSIRTSEALSISNPEVYAILRVHNYDLLYFLIEPAVQPFVDAIHVRVTQGQSAFNNILKLLEGKLHAHI